MAKIKTHDWYVIKTQISARPWNKVSAFLPYMYLVIYASMLPALFIFIKEQMISKWSKLMSSIKKHSWVLTI